MEYKIKRSSLKNLYDQACTSYKYTINNLITSGSSDDMSRYKNIDVLNSAKYSNVGIFIIQRIQDVKYQFSEDIPFSIGELDLIYGVDEYQDILIDICPEYGKKMELKSSLSEAVNKIKTIVDSGDSDNYNKLEGILHEAMTQPIEKEIDACLNFDKDIIHYGSIIDIRRSSGSEYARKAFWLSNQYNWKIVRDISDAFCLVPTIK